MTTDVSQARFLAVAVISSALLVACVPSDKVPVTGHVSLEYERTTDTDVYVRLTNGSARPISLQGSFDIWKRGIKITPGISEIECTAGTKRVRVIIPSALPRRFKGHRCQLYLFFGDAGIGDVDFEP